MNQSITKTPLRAIRDKCIDCCCGHLSEVRMCPVVECALYPYRMGKNPRMAGSVNSGTFKSKINGVAREKTTQKGA